MESDIVNWLDYFLTFIEIIVRSLITIMLLLFFNNDYQGINNILAIISLIWVFSPTLNLINLNNISKKLENEKPNKSN